MSTCYLQVGEKADLDETDPGIPQAWTGAGRLVITIARAWPGRGLDTCRRMLKPHGARTAFTSSDPQGPSRCDNCA